MEELIFKLCWVYFSTKMEKFCPDIDTNILARFYTSEEMAV
jgi:hypothetical protein